MFGRKKQPLRDLSKEALNSLYNSAYAQYEANKTEQNRTIRDDIVNEMNRRFWEEQEKYAKEHPDWWKNAPHREHSGILKD